MFYNSSQYYTIIDVGDLNLKSIVFGRAWYTNVCYILNSKRYFFLTNYLKISFKTDWSSIVRQGQRNLLICSEHYVRSGWLFIEVALLYNGIVVDIWHHLKNKEMCLLGRERNSRCFATYVDKTCTFLRPIRLCSKVLFSKTKHSWHQKERSKILNRTINMTIFCYDWPYYTIQLKSIWCHFQWKMILNFDNW